MPERLSVLYLGAALAGVGAGAVYTTAVGNAAKWFRDRRGLAVGLTAAGFGAGTALTIIPIRLVMASAGYASTFFWFGLIQGGIVLIVAQFIRAPRPGEAPVVSQVKVRQSVHNHSTKEMLTKPVFWVLYLLFLLMAAGGLMATANLAAIAKSYNVANVAVIAGASTLSVGLIFANVMNGVARPFFGWVSDHIGHSHTMAIAFGARCLRLFPDGAGRHQSVGIHPSRRHDLPLLGRDLQPFPGDVHGSVRSEIRDDQPVVPVHREGRRRLPGAVGQPGGGAARIAGAAFST